MTRLRGLVVGIGLFGAMGLWFTASHAGDEPEAVPQPDQITVLMNRIETLEKRIAALELDKEQATRQVNAAYDVPAPNSPPKRLGAQSLPGTDARKPKESSQPRTRIWMHLRNGSPE